jgi:hypothetical protein
LITAIVLTTEIAMQENIITWNVANWVSVVLMALVGFFLLGTVTTFIRNRRSAGQVTSTPNQMPQQSA